MAGGDGIPRVKIKYLGLLNGCITPSCVEPSLNSVLWGELFTEKEREFLRINLIERKFNFTLRDTYEMYARVVFQPGAESTVENIAASGKVQRSVFLGKIALLFHDFYGRTTSSWSWSKLAVPLFKRAFSVMMVDWPGMGKSLVNQIPKVPLEQWISHGATILSMIIDWFHLPKINTLTCGSSCGLLVKLMKTKAHCLAGEQIFFNPVLDMDDLFTFVRITGKTSLRDAKTTWYERQLSELLHLYGITIWAIFDSDHLEECRDTFQLFQRLSTQQICRMNEDGIPKIFHLVTITVVNTQDLTVARIGEKINANFYYPSKRFKQAVCDFFSGEGEFRDPVAFVPETLHLERQKREEVHEMYGRLDVSPSATMTQFSLHTDDSSSALRPGTAGSCGSILSLYPDEGQFVRNEKLQESLYAYSMERCETMSEHNPVLDRPRQSRLLSSDKDKGIRCFGTAWAMPREQEEQDESADVRSHFRMSSRTTVGNLMSGSQTDMPLEPEASASSIRSSTKRALLPAKPKRKRKALVAIDEDLLPEEKWMFETALHNSVTSFTLEQTVRREKKNAMAAYIKEVADAGLTPGVVRYLKGSRVHNQRKPSSVPQTSSAPLLQPIRGSFLQVIEDV